MDVDRDAVVAPEGNARTSSRCRRVAGVALPSGIAVVTMGALVALARSHRRQVPALVHALRQADLRFLAVAAVVMVIGMVNHAALHAASRRAVGLQDSTGSTLGVSVRAAFANKLVKSAGLAAAGVFASDARRRTLPLTPVMVAYGLASVVKRAGFVLAVAICFAAGTSRLLFLTVMALVALVVVVFATRGALGRQARRQSAQRRRQRSYRRSAAIACRVVGWLPSALRARVSDAGPAAAEAMGRARRAPALVLQAFGHAVAVEVLGATVLWAALASVGVSISGGRLAVIYATAAIVGMVGPLPAGLGVIEATLGVSLSRAGLDGPHVVSTIAVYRTFQFWIPLVVGAGAVAFHRRRWRESTAGVPWRWSWARTVVRGRHRLVGPYRVSTGRS